MIKEWLKTYLTILLVVLCTDLGAQNPLFKSKSKSKPKKSYSSSFKSKPLKRKSNTKGSSFSTKQKKNKVNTTGSFKSKPTKRRINQVHLLQNLKKATHLRQIVFLTVKK